MKTNHTKGEWIAVSNTTLYSMIYSKSGKSIAEVKSYGTEKPFNNPTIKQREANARLIAAAPDLLEACIQLFDYYKSECPIPNLEVLKKAQNAIKKSNKMKTTNHSEEIIQSRTGGFGGSDAEMFYMIGIKGLSALNNTYKKRIRVAKGLDEYQSISTPAMQKGHDFEDWYSRQPFAPLGAEREAKIECNFFAKNFKTFAHADFFECETDDLRDSEVWELKCVSDPDNCLNDYTEQLQWYYMLGVKRVWLVVCDSLAESFQAGLRMPRLVEREDIVIDILKEGISILDKNWNTFDLTLKDDWSESDLLPFEQESVLMLRSYLEQIAELEKQSEKHRDSVKKFMELNNVKSIKSDLYQITLIPESQIATLDKSKLFKEHPEIKEQDYTKLSNKKSYVKITLK